MPLPSNGAAIDWEGIDLVIFDVDGTLYDQTRLRVRMGVRLLLDALRQRGLGTLRLIREFRRIRETLADDPDALRLQYELTARRLGLSPQQVEATVRDWLEEQPLPHLPGCRLAGIDRVFADLAAARKTIAVLSDYPVAAKLEALGLKADLMVSACDADVGVLKPSHKGITAILQRCGVVPGRALVIGDRFDRDHEAARRAGVRALIRSRRPHADVPTFQSYFDEPFATLHAGAEGARAKPPSRAAHQALLAD